MKSRNQSCLQELIDAAIREASPRLGQGRVADYIPELARINRVGAGTGLKHPPIARVPLTDGSLVGRLLHTLIGYADRPNGAQLVAYLVTVAMIVGLMRFERVRALAAVKTDSANAATE